MSDFRLEHGKRYVTRDGKVTDGVVWDMRRVGCTDVFYFIGSVNGEKRSWTGNGQYSFAPNCNSDLVREYVEPPPPKYVAFTSQDYIDHLHGKVIVHPEYGRRVIKGADDGGVYVAPDCVTHGGIAPSYESLLEWNFESTGTPCGKLVTP